MTKLNWLYIQCETLSNRDSQIYKLKDKRNGSVLTKELKEEVEIDENNEQIKQAQDVNNMLNELDDNYKQSKKLMQCVYKKVKVNTDGSLHFNTRNQDIYAVVCPEFDSIHGK